MLVHSFFDDLDVLIRGPLLFIHPFLLTRSAVLASTEATTIFRREKKHEKKMKMSEEDFSAELLSKNSLADSCVCVTRNTRDV